MTLARAGFLLLVTSLLQSCGGGGGDGGNNPPPPPPPPSSQLAPLSDVIAVPAAQTSFASIEDAHQVMVFLTSAAEDLHQSHLESSSLVCPQGGTVELSAVDEGGNTLFDANDQVLITYDRCNNLLSGVLGLTISNAVFNSGVVLELGGDVTIDLDYAVSQPTSLTGSGTLDFTLGSHDLTWQGSDFRITFTSGSDTETMTAGRIRKVYSDLDAGYTVSVAATMDVPELGGRFDIETDPAFQAAEGQWPTSGSLVATGRDESKLFFRPGPDTLTAFYEVDADGNGVLDGLAETVAWGDISGGIAFGVYEDPDLPPPTHEPSIFGRRIGLGATAGDMAVNPQLGHIYVTLPSRNELVVFSAQTLEVVRRVPLASRPTGLSVSPDGDEIFVGLYASGALAILDADTFTETRILVAPQLESSTVYKVVETAPGILYVSTDNPANDGRIARVNRSTGVVQPVASTVFGEIELLANPAENTLFALFGPPDTGPRTLMKFDAGNANTPEQRAMLMDGLQGVGRLSLDPGGERIYVSNGSVVTTAALAAVGQVNEGIPWASDNGVDVFVGMGSGDLAIHAADSLRQLDYLETDCGLHFLYGRNGRLMPSPVNGQWLLLDRDVLCAVDLLHPDVPPGTGEPGVLPEPVTVLTVETTALHWASTHFDAAYDEPRKQLYVSLYSAEQLVTMDTETAQVIEQQPLGHTARGIDISPDGSTLAIMYQDNGHLAFKDLATGTITTRDLTALLGSPRGHDVVWLDDDTLFVSANPDCCEEPYDAYLVKVSRSNPAADRRSAGGAADLFGAELALSPAHDYLYVTAGGFVHKLDLAQADEPIIASRQGVAPPMSVSPDGTRILFAGGMVLRTSDFFQDGEYGDGAGRGVFSADGATIYDGISLYMDRYDPSTYQIIDRLQPVAPGGGCRASPWKILRSSDGTRLIGIGQTSGCLWKLDQVTPQGIKPRAHDAYVCGPACLMRNYRKKETTDVRMAPALLGQPRR